MQTLLAIFRIVRPVNLAIIALGLCLFYFYLIVPNHTYQLGTRLLPFTTFDFVLFVLSVVSIAAAGNVINDYYDFEKDRQHKPSRVLPQGHLSLDIALYLHAALVMCGIGLGFYLGYAYNYIKIGYLYVIAALLLYLYPTYLKKIPLLGNIVVAGLSAFVFVLLMLFEINFLQTIKFDFSERILNMLHQALMFYAGFAFLTSLARELVKDIEDYEGDAAFNTTTLAVQYGVPFAKVVTTLVLLALLGALAYFMKGFWEMKVWKEFFYLLSLIVFPVIACIVLLLMAKTRQQFSLVSLLIKAIMLLGILSMPVFYHFNAAS